MQYHYDGFRSGDPHIASPAKDAATQTDNVDVLIVGCGPAGLTLAAQLSAFPNIVTKIVERKPGPLEVGQADGIACRSMEMFEAFGFADRVKKEAYWVNETTFWRPAEGGAQGQSSVAEIMRADRIQDVEDGLSEFPHTILSQARIHDFYLEVMKNSARRLVPQYHREVENVTLTTNADYPVAVTLKCLDSQTDNTTETIYARYVVGCDGARSKVRQSLGYQLQGGSARQLWGVMDILAVTDFPDIRLKCAIQSKSNGSLLIIPREGDYMVRMYIELDALRDDERAADRNVTAHMLVEKAQAIFAPFRLDVKEVAWFSAYEIGQRLCDTFDDVPDIERGTRPPRIFIAGDACHTHSPKAGQGMNVSMADAFNLGWKLAAVLNGNAEPALLDTYSTERRAKAKELIDFDKDMARLFSKREKDGTAAAEFQRYFAKHARYTAGVETRYEASLIVSNAAHQKLALGFTVGMRFHSAPVIRLADAKPMHLGHTIKADGRWRVFAFAGAHDHGQTGGEMDQLAQFMMADAGSSNLHVLAIFQQSHRDLDLEKMPRSFLPVKGRLGLTDYGNIFCADLKNAQNIFDMRGIEREKGALVVVRPDQYVAEVLPLNAHEKLKDFLMFSAGRRETLG